jgi:hypothetical protein
MSKEQDTTEYKIAKVGGGAGLCAIVFGSAGFFVAGPAGGALGASAGGMLGALGGYMLINDGPNQQALEVTSETPEISAPQQNIQISVQPQKVKERDVEKAITPQEEANELTKIAAQKLPATPSDQRNIPTVDLSNVNVDNIPEGTIMVSGKAVQIIMAENQSLKTKVVKLEGDIQNMANDYSISKLALAQVNREKDELKTKVTNLTREKDELTTQVTNLRTEVATLTADNVRLTTANQNMQQQIDQLRADNTPTDPRYGTATEELRAQNAAKDQRISQLESQVTTLTADNARLTADNARLTTQVETLTADNARLTTQVETLTADNAQFRAEFASNRQLIETLMAQVAALTKLQNALINASTQQVAQPSQTISPTSATFSITTTSTPAAAVLAQNQEGEPGEELVTVEHADCIPTPPSSPKGSVANQRVIQTSQQDEQKRV